MKQEQQALEAFLATPEGGSLESLTDGLNPEQLQVVEHFEGPALVVAIAGSGKTTAVVKRIAYLEMVRKVDASEILAVTFSKKAADEMNTRLRALGVRAARVGTWHSLCLQIIKEESFARFDIDAKDRFKYIVKDVLGYKGMGWKNADLTVVRNYIGRCSANLALPGSDRAREVAEEFYEERRCAQRMPDLLFEAYERASQIAEDKGLLTFDAMILKAWQLLTDEGIRAKWASTWNYMIQDEAQDQNLAQATIGEMLCREHRNYMLVGDPGQSIYGFRGAVPKKLLAFREEWDALTIEMVRNYRCGDEIVDVANNVIGHMEPGNHLGTKLVGERKTSGKAEAVQVPDPEAEAAFITERVTEIHADGAPWDSMACLYRTNAQSRAIEEALLSARVPFVVIGGTNFYDRREIKALVSYLRLIDGRGDFDDVSRCINAPFRFLGRAFISTLECQDGTDWVDITRRFAGSRAARLQGRQRTSALEWCGIIEEGRHSKRVSDAYAAMEVDDQITGLVEVDGRSERATEHMPAAILNRLVQRTKYNQWLTRDEGAETTENNKVSNVREMIRAAERFRTVGELLDYIDEMVLRAKQAKRKEIKDVVVLMSIHRSKGLEWDHVFVAGVTENILPHGKAEDIDEERRLFYVAATRARDTLTVIAPTRVAFGPKVMDLGPSRFLDEAGLTLTGEA